MSFAKSFAASVARRGSWDGEEIGSEAACHDARLYEVDPEAKRHPIPGDYVDQLKELYKQAKNPLPSYTQYGWVAG